MCAAAAKLDFINVDGGLGSARLILDLYAGNQFSGPNEIGQRNIIDLECSDRWISSVVRQENSFCLHVVTVVKSHTIFLPNACRLYGKMQHRVRSEERRGGKEGIYRRPPCRDKEGD